MRNHYINTYSVIHQYLGITSKYQNLRGIDILTCYQNVFHETSQPTSRVYRHINDGVDIGGHHLYTSARRRNLPRLLSNSFSLLFISSLNLCILSKSKKLSMYLLAARNKSFLQRLLFGQTIRQ